MIHAFIYSTALKEVLDPGTWILMRGGTSELSELSDLSSCKMGTKYFLFYFWAMSSEDGQI